MHTISVGNEHRFLFKGKAGEVKGISISRAIFKYFELDLIKIELTLHTASEQLVGSLQETDVDHAATKLGD